MLLLLLLLLLLRFRRPKTSQGCRSPEWDGSPPEEQEKEQEKEQEMPSRSATQTQERLRCGPAKNYFLTLDVQISALEEVRGDVSGDE